MDKIQKNISENLKLAIISATSQITSSYVANNKIEKNEKGKYEIIKSEPVDNLNDLPLEYQYIKENFYDIVNLYNKDEIFDYEDGPEEDKEIINENEFNDEQSISR